MKTKLSILLLSMTCLTLSCIKGTKTVPPRSQSAMNDGVVANCMKLTAVESLPAVDPRSLELSSVTKDEAIAGTYKKFRILVKTSPSSPEPDTIWYQVCSLDDPTQCEKSHTITGIDYNPRVPKGPIKLAARACVFEARARVKDSSVHKITLKNGATVFCGPELTSFARQDDNPQEKKLEAYLTEQYGVNEEIEALSYEVFNLITSPTGTRLSLTSTQSTALDTAKSTIKAMGPGLFAAYLSKDFRDNLKSVAVLKKMNGEKNAKLQLTTNSGDPCVSEQVIAQAEEYADDPNTPVIDPTDTDPNTGDPGDDTPNGGNPEEDPNGGNPEEDPNGGNPEDNPHDPEEEEPSPNSGENNSNDGTYTTKRDALIALYSIGGALTVGGGLAWYLGAKRKVAIQNEFRETLPEVHQTINKNNGSDNGNNPGNRGLGGDEYGLRPTKKQKMTAIEAELQKKLNDVDDLHPKPQPPDDPELSQDDKARVKQIETEIDGYKRLQNVVSVAFNEEGKLFDQTKEDLLRNLDSEEFRKSTGIFDTLEEQQKFKADLEFAEQRGAIRIEDGKYKFGEFVGGSGQWSQEILRGENRIDAIENKNGPVGRKLVPQVVTYDVNELTSGVKQKYVLEVVDEPSTLKQKKALKYTLVVVDDSIDSLKAEKLAQKKSLALMSNTELPVERISVACGFGLIADCKIGTGGDVKVKHSTGKIIANHAGKIAFFAGIATLISASMVHIFALTESNNELIIQKITKIYQLIKKREQLIPLIATQIKVEE